MARLVLLLVCLLFVGGIIAEHHAGPINTAAHKLTNDYWTAERRDAAIPVVQTVEYVEENMKATSEPDGVPTLWKGFQGEAEQTVNADPKDKSINLTSPLAYPFPYSSFFVSAGDYNNYPFRVVGKLFFSSGGFNFVCSGATVTPNMIYTAAHCVYNLTTRTWNTNFMFYPGYNAGPHPTWGGWNWWQPWARTEYTGSSASSPNRAYDFAHIVMQTKASGTQKIGNLVGWFGAGWNYPYSQTFRACGYPQAAPFNGLYDYVCDSATGVIDTAYSPNTIGIGCDATGGASGGPWVINWGTNYYINSVNGYKYTSPAQPLAMYGSYFGTIAQTLFNSANAVVPGCC